MNKISKGVYELGSIFKTFTVALAMDNDIVTPKTIIKNLPQSVSCSKYEISDIKNFPKNLSVEDILVRSSNIGTLLIARKIGEEKYKKFINDAKLLKSPEIQLEEVGNPINFDWNKCKLETVSYGHGITTTPLQAATVYASLTNGGKLIRPNLIKGTSEVNFERIVSKKTSKQINDILRKVVTDEEGTASLADVFGYNVGGKTGTSEKYLNKKENLNTFISVFPSQKPKYVLLVMPENPQVAEDLITLWGLKIKAPGMRPAEFSICIKIIKKLDHP